VLTTRGLQLQRQTAAITVGPQGGTLAYEGGRDLGDCSEDHRTRRRDVRCPSPLGFASNNNDTITLGSAPPVSSDYQGPTVLNAQKGRVGGRARRSLGTWTSKSRIRRRLRSRATAGTGSINMNGKDRGHRLARQRRGRWQDHQPGRVHDRQRSISPSVTAARSRGTGSFTKVGNRRADAGRQQHLQRAWTNVNGGGLLINGAPDGHRPDYRGQRRCPGAAAARSPPRSSSAAPLRPPRSTRLTPANLTINNKPHAGPAGAVLNYLFWRAGPSNDMVTRQRRRQDGCLLQTGNDVPEH